MSNAVTIEPEGIPRQARLRTLNILPLMLCDPRFGSKALGKSKFAMILQTHGKDQQIWRSRIEELFWLTTLPNDVGGWRGDEVEYYADYCMMHAVTRSSPLSAYTCPAHPKQSRSEHTFDEGHPVARLWSSGFPNQRFHVAAAPAASEHTILQALQHLPTACALPYPTSPFAIIPNPWYPILTDMLIHPSKHLSKVQWALVHFSALYGHQEAGFVFDALAKDGVNADPEYAYLGGSVFLRVAWLTSAALGRVSCGEDNSGIWNYQDFERGA